MAHEKTKEPQPAETRSDKVKAPPIDRDEAENIEEKGQPFDGIFA